VALARRSQNGLAVAATTPTLANSGNMDVAVHLAGVLDLGVAARLLPAEIVGRKPRTTRPCGPYLSYSASNPCTDRCTALAGGVDRQNHPSGVDTQAPGFTVDVLEGVIEQGGQGDAACTAAFSISADKRTATLMCGSPCERDRMRGRSLCVAPSTMAQPSRDTQNIPPALASRGRPEQDVAVRAQSSIRGLGDSD
jgi:hypothetical protein